MTDNADPASDLPASPGPPAARDARREAQADALRTNLRRRKERGPQKAGEA